MPANKEISALLHLIDDPDQEVFDTVSEKILHYGIKIIPNLESLWEETPDEKVQERIELLIHRVHFKNLQTDFKQWMNEEDPDLFDGSLLVARYRYPGLNMDSLIYELDKIKRNIWLELNNYLTPLEQTNILNSMIYSYFNMKGAEVSYSRANQFYLNNVIESRKGNSISIGILYQMLCSQLDIPIYAVNIPKQYILAYFNHPIDFSLPEDSQLQDIQFYIDPLQGHVYTSKDIEVYLKKINTPFRDFYFKPLSNKSIIRLLLIELSKCYENKKELYCTDELLSLADMLKEEARH
ncbi:MAG: transglutaminase-like domain-containing protein [Chitinophagaceae bacterium]